MFQEMSGALQDSLVELADRGYVVRPAIGQCQNCAGNLVRDVVENVIANEDPKAIHGVVFWSKQDEQDRVDYGSFYVAYGSIPIGDIVVGDPEVEVGQAVCKVFHAHGLRCDWNGTKDKRILAFEPNGERCPPEPQVSCNGSGCINHYQN